MMIELSVGARAALHRALGDERRLAIVDALQLSDWSVGALADLTDLPTNLLTFHLGVLEEAGVIARSASQGDARRRYVTLDVQVLPMLGPPPALADPVRDVLFVCTANSARSQLAAHLWQRRTGRPALSAGTRPAVRVDPDALDTARRHGLDLEHARPTALQDVQLPPDLAVTVCDRAHESAAGLEVPRLHWSIPDPAGEGAGGFEAAYLELTARVDRLADASRVA